MSDCECLAVCVFFNDKMKHTPATVDLVKQRLCRADNSQCARYYVFSRLGRGHVPPDLFPNQMERAVELVRERRHGIEQEGERSHASRMPRSVRDTKA